MFNCFYMYCLLYYCFYRAAPPSPINNAIPLLRLIVYIHLIDLGPPPDGLIFNFSKFSNITNILNLDVMQTMLLPKNNFLSPSNNNKWTVFKASFNSTEYTLTWTQLSLRDSFYYCVQNRVKQTIAGKKFQFQTILIAHFVKHGSHLFWRSIPNKTILVYSGLTEPPGRHRFIEDNCPVSNCILTGHSKFYKTVGIDHCGHPR